MTSMINGLSDPKRIDLAKMPNFRLGSMAVRPATREVLSEAGRDVLEPRVMEALVVLAHANGEVVSRDELIARCWHGRIVTDDAINRVISRLRRLARDIGAQSWTLETITKVGYRITIVGPATVEDPPAPTRQASRRGILLASGAGLALAVAGGLSFVGRRSPVSPEARGLYENGRAAMRQAFAEQNAQAVGLLRQAIAVQPDYAEAWGALALAYQAGLQFAPADQQDALKAAAAAAAEKALSLDPRSEDAHVALALLAPIYRNWVAAEALYGQALKAAPDHAVLQYSYGYFLLSVGRVRESVISLQRAVERDPYAPYYRYQLAMALWGSGRLSEAEKVLQDALRIWPRHYALWFLRFWSFVYTGRSAQALAHLSRVEGRPINVPQEDFDLYRVTAQAIRSRSPPEVSEAIAVNLRAARTGQGYAENAMLVQAFLGALDGAFTTARALYLNEGGPVGALRWTVEQGMYNPRDERKTFALFGIPAAAMRRDRRFEALVNDMGLDDYWRASKKPPDYR